MSSKGWCEYDEKRSQQAQAQINAARLKRKQRNRGELEPEPEDLVAKKEATRIKGLQTKARNRAKRERDEEARKHIIEENPESSRMAGKRSARQRRMNCADLYIPTEDTGLDLDTADVRFAAAILASIRIPETIEDRTIPMDWEWMYQPEFGSNAKGPPP